MFEIFKLAGRVIVDSSDADKALDGTDKKAEKTTNAIGEYASKFKTWAAGLVTVSTIVAGLKKSWEISSEVIELGNSITENAQKFQLSTEKYQEYAFIAEHFGFSIEQLGDSVVELSKKVGEGGNDTINGLLEELGIDLADAMTATPEDLFEMVVQGLQDMEDSTRKIYIADQLFGGGAKEMAAWLSSTKDETQALIDKFHELRGVMSETLLQATSDTKDARTNLNAAWQGIKNDLGERTVPEVAKIINGLTEMLTGDFADGLKMAADGVTGYLEACIDALDNYAKNARLSLKNSLGFDPLGGLDVSLFNPFLTPEKAEDKQEQVIAFSDAINYGKYGDRAGTIGGLWDSFWDSITSGEAWNNIRGKPTAPDMSEMRRAYDYYIGQGGTQSDFMYQAQYTYGEEFAQQFSEYLETQKGDVSAATSDYTTAMDAGAAAWDQATTDYAAANRGAASRITAAADRFAEAADRLYGDAASSLYGNAAGKLYGGFGHANGIPFIPRDNYPARLHYGERVLTRQENEDYSRGQGAGGSTTINIQTVPQSPAQTAAAITAALARARWAM